MRVIYLDGAGSYGPNGADDAAAEAALLSKTLGKPVRVQWTRQEEHGLDPKEAMALVALTQYTDMIRALGEGSRTNTILLPHSPSGVGDLMAQIRDGILIADAATEGNIGGPRKALPGAQADSGTPAGR